MINIIWGLFIIFGIIYSFLIGNINIVNDEILKSGIATLEMIMQIFPVMAIWLGLMNIALDSGLLNKLSKFLTPLLGKLFPEIPKGHESLGFIASNIAINMFGLGSVATPFGLKGIKSLQEINPKKDTASRSMITFLVLNTSGVTIIPTMIISLRMMYKSANPTEVVFACILATLASTVAGLLMDRILAKGCEK